MTKRNRNLCFGLFKLTLLNDLGFTWFTFGSKTTVVEPQWRGSRGVFVECCLPRTHNSIMVLVVYLVFSRHSSVVLKA